MNQKLIERLRKGEIAVRNDGLKEQIVEVIKAAFPEDLCIPEGKNAYYYAKNTRNWDSNSSFPAHLELVSVKDFFQTGVDKTFPRVMLVSGDNDISKAMHRVVFMRKRDKYIAWNMASTLEGAEEAVHAFAWKYAWEVEEKSIFPFQLKPQDAQKIIDTACTAWKGKLATQWGYTIVIGDNVEVQEEFYNAMYKACTAEQKQLFDEIFK